MEFSELKITREEAKRTRTNISQYVILLKSRLRWISVKALQKIPYLQSFAHKGAKHFANTFANSIYTLSQSSKRFYRFFFVNLYSITNCKN